MHTGKHTRKGGARTPISMTHLTGKGARVQLSTHLRARVVKTVDTPTSLLRWGEGGEERAPQIHEVRAGERRQALEELDGLGGAQVRPFEPVL